jgi:NNP family nitrate/nitrite transporter-like MFS transporter
VAGIIGAGGNAGAVAAGFLMKGLGNVQQTLTVLGIVVAISALCAIAARFSNTASEGAVAAEAAV